MTKEKVDSESQSAQRLGRRLSVIGLKDIYGNFFAVTAGKSPPIRTLSLLLEEGLKNFLLKR